jgi:predicted acylesterase/phospholipase RssA
MLRELTRWGISADFVVGSSVGAINASYFAGAPNPAGIEKLETIWRALRRHDVFPFTLGSALGLLGRPDNLIDPSNLRRLLERHLPFPNLEDAMRSPCMSSLRILGTLRFVSPPAQPSTRSWRARQSPEPFHQFASAKTTSWTAQ